MHGVFESRMLESNKVMIKERLRKVILEVEGLFNKELRPCLMYNQDTKPIRHASIPFISSKISYLKQRVTLQVPR